MYSLELGYFQVSVLCRRVCVLHKHTISTAHLHTQLCALVHAYAHTHSNTNTCTHVHTSTRTLMYTRYIHSYTHAHMYTGYRTHKILKKHNTGTGNNFPRHDRNPQVSTSEVNLAREYSVDFDYVRIPLIKTHGENLISYIYINVC